MIITQDRAGTIGNTRAINLRWCNNAERKAVTETTLQLDFSLI